MNIKTTLLFLVVIVVISFSCGNKKEDHSSGQSVNSNEWKQMDDFHMVMAETFHPYKDSADLAPAKAKVNELVAAADKWVNAPLPEKVDTDEVRTKLQTLKSETELLADVIQNGEDETIGTQLNKVHDLFHEIQEMWYTNEGNGHHGHSH